MYAEREATSNLNRRQFVTGAAAAGALAAVAGSAQVAHADEVATANTDAADEELVPEETLEADVVVVGCGVAGISAATAAAEEGASVIVFDPATGVIGTNAVNTVGIYGVGDPDKVYDHFDELTADSNYMLPNSFLMNYLHTIDSVMNRYMEHGMTIIPNPSDLPTEENPGYFGAGSIIGTFSYILPVSGMDRADEYEAMLASYSNIDQRWEHEVKQLVIDESGKVTGVIAVDADGKVVQANAKGGVVVCCGGFIHNQEMVEQYMGGATVYSFAHKHCDGAGIKLAQSAGAQMGKNFALNLSEGGGLNHKSSEFNSSLFGTRGVSRSPLIGDVILNRRGERFVNEAVMVQKTAMFCSEAFTREGGTFYTVMTQAEIDELASKSIIQYCQDRYGYTMQHPIMAMFFADPLTTIADDAQAAIDEDWAWKGDTFEELEHASGMTGLAQTMDRYNGYCEAGLDEEMHKDAAYLLPYGEEDGPFYLVEHDLSAWTTQGGIIIDRNCRALNHERAVIEGLYVAGTDADDNMTPYKFGGTCQGFSVGSGAIAGKHAAEVALG